jgi:hypothetical protein
VNPGFHVEGMAEDLKGRPSHLACQDAAEEFRRDLEVDEAVCLVACPISPTHVWVAVLASHRRWTGLAGRAFAALMDACDRHGVAIELRSSSMAGDVQAFQDGLAQLALDAFYARRGFVASDRAGAMVRRPDQARIAA